MIQRKSVIMKSMKINMQPEGPHMRIYLLSLALSLILAAPAFAADNWLPFDVGKPTPVTRTPGHHFYGYFGISPWDETGRYMLCLRSEFHDRMPEAEDKAVIGLVDLQDNRKFIPITETYAWNFQQGSFQRWLPTAPDKLIIYNDRIDDRLVSFVLDVWTGEKRELPRPISNVTRDGTRALSLNYARLRRLRPVIGYPGVTDPTEGVDQPEDDGVFSMDIESGDSKLLVSIADVVRAYKGDTDLSGKTMWLSHTYYNPSGTRFLFLARYLTAFQAFDTAMFTADARTGGDLRLAIDFGNGVSHFGWIDDETIIATMDLENEGKGSAHVMFRDGTTDYKRIAPDILTEDGHPSLSPDGRWLITDTYPDARQKQKLILVDMRSRKGVVLGEFDHPIRYFNAIRCDLHPRWNADGDTISFDTLDGKGRQMYIIRLKPKDGSTE